MRPAGRAGARTAAAPGDSQRDVCSVLSSVPVNFSVMVCPM